MFVWDITTGSNDERIYAVEYRGKKLRFADERIIGKARRIAHGLTGNRKAMMLENSAVEPYEQGHEIVQVPLGTRPLAKWRGHSRPVIHEYDNGDEYDWENFLEDVQDRMDGGKYWRIDGKGIDWRGRDGYKFVEAEDAEKLLEAIYHEGHLILYASRGGFELKVGTHDTPMGAWYRFTAIGYLAYERNA